MKILGFLIIMLLMTGCAEKTHCSAYPVKGLNWMPYQRGDKFSFTDGISTFQLKVDEAYKSNAYTQRKGSPIYRLCTVEAHAMMTSSSFLSEIEFMSSCPEPEPQGSGNIDTTMIFYNMLFLSSNAWSSFGFTMINGQIQNKIALLSCYNNGHKEYFNVLKLEHDTLVSDYPICQVYVAEAIGIIQFKDRRNHKTWNLIGKE